MKKKKIFIMNNEKKNFWCRKSRTGLLPKCVVTHSVCCDLDVVWCWALAGRAGRARSAQAGSWACRRDAGRAGGALGAQAVGAGAR